ncbi:hypothetical protein M758_1G320800 [Ceratodon purpureus]|nr:hypothetical protein M758_1G320800 [Ceratodon purpureus]
MASLSCRAAVAQSISVSVPGSRVSSANARRGCGGVSLRSSFVSRLELGGSVKLVSCVRSKACVLKTAGVRAAVGADNVVTEPATSIKFSSSLTVPDSSTALSLLGVGVRLKQIAFLKVQVYALGIYAEVSNMAASLASFKGTPTDILVKNDALFKKLAEAPVEKAIQIKLVRDVDGATFWGALDEALVPRLKASDGAGAEGDAALAALGNVFKDRSLKKGFVITLTWVQPSTLKIAVAENESASLKTESSIESKSLLFALYDVFLGLDAVSPSAKASVAEGITKLL